MLAQFIFYIYLGSSNVCVQILIGLLFYTIVFVFTLVQHFYIVIIYETYEIQEQEQEQEQG